MLQVRVRSVLPDVSRHIYAVSAASESIDARKINKDCTDGLNVWMLPTILLITGSLGLAPSAIV